MVNKPRNIGTAGETAVVRYLVANGFPYAERRSLKGFLDCGDITGTPGICWEVKAGAAAKNASDGQVTAWLAETETERRNARATIGVLILARKGIGATNAGRWWAILSIGHVIDLCRPAVSGSLRTESEVPVRMHLADVVTLLRIGGYGDALTTEVTA